jgi:hypothetical protein
VFALAAPAKAQQIPPLLQTMYGIKVNIVPPGQVFPVEANYLYSPALGAYLIGEDPNFANTNFIDAGMRKMFLPQADPVMRGFTIPFISGPIQPIDQNRGQIMEGLHEAAPDGFYHRGRVAPWYSHPDEKLCSAEFENAWTYSSDVVAPEVEVYATRLPNQKGESVLIGSLKKKFPVVVSSAFGQILIKDSAKALVARSADELRVFNLTGGPESVMVRFPSGKIVAIGPGSELVVGKNKEALAAMPSDGIARRGVSRITEVEDQAFLVNEFAPHSLLKATGFHHALANAENGRDKRFCNHVLKTAAVLAMMKGGTGFAASGAMLAGYPATTGGAHEVKHGKQAAQGLQPDIIPTSQNTQAPIPGEVEDELPNISKGWHPLKRCSAVLMGGLKHKSKTAAVPSSDN